MVENKENRINKANEISSSMEDVLKVNNVSKKYKENIVLNDINFSIKKGEVIGLVGPNGAGKTTLMRIIMNLIRKYEGNIELFAEEGKKNIGCIIEHPSFYPNLSGYDNLKYFSEIAGGYSKQHVQSLINLLSIEGFIDKKVKKYSLGMKQRLGIAQALLNNPELLILDEPTNGLDPEGVVEIRNVINNIASTHGISVLISSHILTEIENVCHKAIFLSKGTIVNTVDLNRDSEIETYNTYTIETQYVDLTERVLINRNINVLLKGNAHLTFDVQNVDIEKLIINLVHDSVRFTAIYPQKDNLESRFFALLEGNQIE